MTPTNHNKQLFHSWHFYSLIIIILVVITALIVVVFWSISKPKLPSQPQTPLTIKAVEPNSGPVAGGTTITVHGSGFALAQ